MIKGVIARGMKQAARNAANGLKKPLKIKKDGTEAHWEYVDTFKTLEKGRREHRAKQAPGYKKAIKDMDEGRAEYRRTNKKKER